MSNLRTLPAAIVIIVCLCGGPQNGAAADANAGPTTLMLLGTAGGPGGYPERAGIASLVTVAGKHYLVDAGEGVSRQLARSGSNESAVPVVFLTHLHDDHTAGLPGLMSFAYTLRSPALEVIGPPGTQRLVEGALAFLQPNAEIRGAERRLPAPAEVIRARELGTGEAWSDGTVTVTAVENTHFHLSEHPLASRNRSYSYRFETPDQVIVFTGDTGPSAAVEELARGADLLVSEMVSASDVASVPPQVVKHMLEEHLTPAEAGKLAARAGVRALILSHLRDVSEADVAEIRRHFTGRVVVGKDLDRF